MYAIHYNRVHLVCVMIIFYVAGEQEICIKVVQNTVK